MSRKSKTIPFIISCLFIINTVFALDYRDICLTNTTLQKSINFTTCEEGNCTDYNFTQTKICEFGCDNVTHSCRQPQIVEYAEFFGSLSLLLILGGILAKIFKK